MRFVATVFLVLLSVTQAEASELQYGDVASYTLNGVVAYPDFRVVYRGERVSPDHGGKRVRDFEIYTDCTMFSVSWPLGSQEPLAIDSGVGPFVLEFGYSKTRKRPLKTQELIAWDRPGYDQELMTRP